MLSYNTNWWHYEQEANGAANWEIPSKQRCWYGIITKNKLEQDELCGLYYIEHGTAQEMQEAIMGYYLDMGYAIRLRRRCHNGYLPADCFGVLPYLGQWGKGWIVATHDSRSTVSITYIILLPKGGNSNALADYYE